MRCPTLTELPPPPPGKTGWPWTEESPQLPESMSDGQPWPKISIITPTYNRSEFLEEALRSVLLQGYPNLEYIILDGGSTDGSVDIIKKYDPWITYWESKPDDGLYHAINKGILVATGEIVGHINSDDLYEWNIFGAVAATFRENNGAHIVTGGAIVFKETSDGKRYLVSKYTGPPDTELSFESIAMGTPIINARFFRREVYNRVGRYNTRYKIAADKEFLLRVALANFANRHMDQIVYCYREHPGSLTINRDTVHAITIPKEYMKIAKHYLQDKSIPEDLARVCKHWHRRESVQCIALAIKKRRLAEALKCLESGWRVNATFALFLAKNAFVRATHLIIRVCEKIIKGNAA